MYVDEPYFSFILQKLQERLAALNKAKLSDKDREKWEKVFIVDMMSSEESGSEEDSDIVVKPLPWRSSRVSRFFSQMDKYTTAKKSSQAKRQTKARVLGAPSARPPPTDLASWAVVN